MAFQPTHRVSHKDGSVVDIEITTENYRNLYCGNTAKEIKARDYLCILFKTNGEIQLGSTWAARHQFVRWMRIESIEPIAANESTEYIDGDRECDDCTMCETGYHERCVKRDGCPNADLR